MSSIQIWSFRVLLPLLEFKSDFLGAANSITDRVEYTTPHGSSKNLNTASNQHRGEVLVNGKPFNQTVKRDREKNRSSFSKSIVDLEKEILKAPPSVKPLGSGEDTARRELAHIGTKLAMGAKNIHTPFSPAPSSSLKFFNKLTDAMKEQEEALHDLKSLGLEIEQPPQMMQKIQIQKFKSHSETSNLAKILENIDSEEDNCFVDQARPVAEAQNGSSATNKAEIPIQKRIISNFSRPQEKLIPASPLLELQLHSRANSELGKFSSHELVYPPDLQKIGKLASSDVSNRELRGNREKDKEAISEISYIEGKPDEPRFSSAHEKDVRLLLHDSQTPTNLVNEAKPIIEETKSQPFSPAFLKNNQLTKVMLQNSPVHSNRDMLSGNSHYLPTNIEVARSGGNLSSEICIGEDEEEYKEADSDLFRSAIEWDEEDSLEMFLKSETIRGRWECALSRGGHEIRDKMSIAYYGEKPRGFNPKFNHGRVLHSNSRFLVKIEKATINPLNNSNIFNSGATQKKDPSVTFTISVENVSSTNIEYISMKPKIDNNLILIIESDDSNGAVVKDWKR